MRYSLLFLFILSCSEKVDNDSNRDAQNYEVDTLNFDQEEIPNDERLGQKVKPNQFKIDESMGMVKVERGLHINEDSVSDNMSNKYCDEINRLCISLLSKPVYKADRLDKGEIKIAICDEDSIHYGINYFKSVDRSFEDRVKQTDEYFTKISFSEEKSVNGWRSIEFHGEHAYYEIRGLLIDYKDVVIYLWMDSKHPAIDEYYSDFIKTLELEEKVGI